MDLNQLRTFVAVCEEKNLTKAAHRLFMTPPSVSAHIKALEEELDVTLFLRSSKGMELTEKGTVLQEKAEQTLQSAQELVNYATAIRSYLMGRVVVGLNAVPKFLRVGPLTRHLQEQCPGMELTFINSVSGKIIRDLKKKRLDAGYIFGPVFDSELAAQRVCTTNLVVVTPTAWQDKIAGAGWKEMADLPWITSESYCPFQDIANDLFKERGLQYRRVAQTDDEITKRELVSSGVGVALFEETEATQAVAEGDLTIWETAPIPCDLSFVCLRIRREEPLIQSLTDAVEQIWRVN